MRYHNWFKEAKLGMIIHWGAYSVAARGEWTFNRECLTKEEYTEQYVNHFKAENYDPSVWAKLAKKAGMQYAYLTAKHHDGFCLWDTGTTDFNSVKMGPKRDLVKAYVEAFRAEGLKVGIYYSPGDWNHPDYPDPCARDWPNEWHDEEARQRFVKYYMEQLRELMTNYGKIDLLWYDGCIPKPMDGAAANAMVRELQPDILINNRNGKPCDFYICEGAIAPPPIDVPWEATMCTNNHWGYHATDHEYKSARSIIHMLLKAARDEGNLCLNLGPRADGSVPEPYFEIFEKVGSWLEKNREAIFDTVKIPFSWNPSSELTMNQEKVFISLKYGMPQHTVVEIKNKVKRVYKLSTGEDMDFRQDEKGRLTIFGTDMEVDMGIASVYACVTEGKPEAIRPKTYFWIPGYEV